MFPTFRFRISKCVQNIGVIIFVMFKKENLQHFFWHTLYERKILNMSQREFQAFAIRYISFFSRFSMSYEYLSRSWINQLLVYV